MANLVTLALIVAEIEVFVQTDISCVRMNMKLSNNIFYVESSLCYY